jgi:hypothetical protein
MVILIKSWGCVVLAMKGLFVMDDDEYEERRGERTRGYLYENFII